MFKKIIVFVFLLIIGVIPFQATAQKNPNKVIKRELRHIKNGKTDTLTSLIIMNDLLNQSKLKSKNRKLVIKSINENYEWVISSSQKKINLAINTAENLENAYVAFQNYQSLIQLYKTRITFENSLVKTKDDLKISIKESVEELEGKVTEFSEKRESMRIPAADYFYKKGKRFVESGSSKNKVVYHNAYNDFKQALAIAPDYLDTKELLKVAQEKGAVRIKILPLEVNNSSYGRSVSESVKHSISKYIEKYHKSTPFVHISWNMPNPDITVKILVNAPSINNTVNKPSTHTDEKNIKLDDEDKKVKVTARVTNHQKFSEASLGSTAYIRTKEGGLIKELYTTGHQNWSSSWATYTGNKKALDKSSRREVSKSEEPFPKKENMIKEALQSHNYNLDKLFLHLKTLVR